METTTKEKYKNQYCISSTRANWHDYNGGFYHVTVCTKDRELFLGKIENGEMKMSEIGKYAEELFRNVTYVLVLFVFQYRLSKYKQ